MLSFFPTALNIQVTPKNNVYSVLRKLVYIILTYYKLNNVLILKKVHKCDTNSITKDMLRVNASLNSNDKKLWIAVDKPSTELTMVKAKFWFV